jgi:imidazolonepropionase-like amidohydrolase
MKRSLTVLAIAVLATLPALAASTAFKGATIHPVSGPPIENGVMLLDGSKIVAVGADVTIPAGAEIIDVSGKHLYPGFVSANSVLGLIEVSAVRSTRDYNEIGEINSDLRAEVAVNADSRLLPVAISGGVLTAHVVLNGGVLTGSTAVISLSGWNWEDMTVRAGVAMRMRYPQVTAGRRSKPEEVKEQLEKSLKTINKTFDDAEAYMKARNAGADIDLDAKLEGLIPVLTGEMSLLIAANEKNQIESALDWTAERELDNIILISGPDVQYVAERLAEENVPVILSAVHTLPSRRWEPYDMPFVAAAKLHEAGVTFAIAGDNDSNVRNIPFEAATAAAYGLPKDVALRSVTLAPAEILGVAERVGSLDAGKDASFLVTDGDPLEIMTRIERVWIGGVEVDLSENPQYRLYEKYDNRPRRE